MSSTNTFPGKKYDCMKMLMVNVKCVSLHALSILVCLRIGRANMCSLLSLLFN